MSARLANHARPFDTSIKSHFWKILSTFGDKCPENGSKSEEMAPRTRTGYPTKGRLWFDPKLAAKSVGTGNTGSQSPSRFPSRFKPVWLNELWSHLF